LIERHLDLAATFTATTAVTIT